MQKGLPFLECVCVCVCVCVCNCYVYMYVLIVLSWVFPPNLGMCLFCCCCCSSLGFSGHKTPSYLLALLGFYVVFLFWGCMFGGSLYACMPGGSRCRQFRSEMLCSGDRLSSADWLPLFVSLGMGLPLGGVLKCVLTSGCPWQCWDDPMQLTRC